MSTTNREKKKKKGASDPLDIMKSLSKRVSRRPADTGSNDSNSGGNNSDNSALVSLGNTSFGFNFDSEDSNASQNNENPNSEQNSEDGDRTDRNSEDNKPEDAKLPARVTGTRSSSDDASSSKSKKNVTSDSKQGTSVSSITKDSKESTTTTSSESRARSEASFSDAAAGLRAAANYASAKRKSGDNDSGGYNTDNDEEDEKKQPDFSTRKRKRSKKHLDERKREERNAREKERSFRISKQIAELRELLASGGIIVPKTTKSSVLSEAATYIRTLQQHQYRSEIDRHQLVQQMQLIGSGANGPHAAKAVRHAAAQNGVWSLGNFGGIPPKSAMTFYQPSGDKDDTNDEADVALKPSSISSSEYRYVFNSCGVGMAIASMGGAFIDCNHLFTQLSNYTKQELCSMTIFNLTAREDLQDAFDLMSQMISPPMNAKSSDFQKPIVLRGAMKERNDLGISVSLIRGEDRVTKCFCVTLIKNPSSPQDTSEPVPVSFESVRPREDTKGKPDSTSDNDGPAYATG